MFDVNEVVSERLKVPELTEDEVAVYKLLASDEIDRSRTEESSGKHLLKRPTYSIPGKKSIYDPFHKIKVYIGNVEGIKHEKMPTGELKEVPQLKRVTFPSTGLITVSHREQGKYRFLERLNENRDNPFRDPNIKPKFYRLNSKRQALKELEDDYVKVDALYWVRKANEVELKTIYKGLGEDFKTKINAEEGFERLKRDIFKIAETNPIAVLKASGNKEAKIKIQCIDAEKFRIIIFDESNDSRTWIFRGDKPVKICDVEVGEHRIDALVQYFIKNDEGKAWYGKIVEALKQVLAPVR